MTTKYYIDADSDPSLVEASVALCGYWNIPTLFRLKHQIHKTPKFIRNLQRTAWCEFDLIETFRAGKETVDKHILVAVQRAILEEGVKNFYVFSRDHDFWYDFAEIEKRNPGTKIIVVYLLRDEEKIPELPKNHCEVKFQYIKHVRSLDDQTKSFDLQEKQFNEETDLCYQKLALTINTLIMFIPFRF